MTSAVVARHLAVLGGRPRPAGTDSERDARNYAIGVLASLGFRIREESFEYSAFPGRYATPLAGAVLGIAIVSAGALSLGGRATAALATLVAALLATAAFARWMLVSGVLDTPWMRATSVNVAATRGDAEPAVWLVAHLDSKSQPVPSAARVAGVVVLAVGIGLAVLAAALTLAGVPARTLWWVAMGAGVVGALPVMASVVGSASDGAVDNASGVASVLAAAALLGKDVACGVLLPSAEELGLAGARAWVRTHSRGLALNCDGVDDGGELVIMYNTPLPADVVDAVRNAASAAGTPRVRVRRMPLGLLTDSTALSGGGWRAVTVSHGSLETLRRVHTSKDSLANLRGTSIDGVAAILARAAEALAT
jgi:hypothetical protein